MVVLKCPDCGIELSSGLCPRCMIKLGIDGAGSSDLGADVTFDPSLRPGSVMATLAATIGVVPHVMLRDTLPNEHPSPIISPTPDGTDTTLRYRIDGEIARGGMGAVLRGRAPDLGRDVAIKVLREDLRDNQDLIRRFVEEAQIGGQLQHPGIVPIYELGTFADRRPFFCMKLVKGQTLAGLLSSRVNPATEVPKFLSIFAAMAQTMAYAHTRGVIHRDLKPSNIMVGSFAEVQVMDWGLAKVLTRGGVADDAKAGKEPDPETLIATARSESDSDLSHAGSVMGTPSYMPPEQAQGEIDRIDERADVFALGSILAEILTGQPAFTGQNSGEILRKAARGDTREVLARLQVCGADADLITLAVACLAPEVADRPRDATAVANRITAYLAGVQERFQAAERDRAVAEAQVIEERKRRRLQRGLAAAMLALITLAGLGLLHEQNQRSARAATVARVVGEVTILRNQARANPDDPARWRTALAAATQAEGVVGGLQEAIHLLSTLKQEIQAGAEAADRDRILLDKLAEIRSSKSDQYSNEENHKTDAAYAQAFKDAGLDLSSLAPPEAGAKIQARPPAVAQAMAAALDDWASENRDERDRSVSADRLSSVARLADPDPWRNELRLTLALKDKVARRVALQTLASTAKVEELGPVSLVLLGEGLSSAGDPASAEKLLRRAQTRHPGDVWININLAGVLDALDRPVEAIRFYTAVRVLSPELASGLIVELAKQGESEEAMAVFQDLVRLRPKDGVSFSSLGYDLDRADRPKEAEVVFEHAIIKCRETIRLDPNNAQVYRNLGYALYQGKRYNESIAAYREALRLAPDDIENYRRLGETLTGRRLYDEAVEVYGNALRLAPTSIEIYRKLGNTLMLGEKTDEAVKVYRKALRHAPNEAECLSDLGEALSSQKKNIEAINVYREALRNDVDCFSAHAGLGYIFLEEDKLDQAVSEFRIVVRYNPENYFYSQRLASTLELQGKFEEAAAIYREDIRYNPDSISSYHLLGDALLQQGKPDEAVAVYRQSVELEPKNEIGHVNLGDVLWRQGKQEEAIAEYCEAIRVKPKCIIDYSRIASSMASAGRVDEAMAAYREAIRLNSNDADACVAFGEFLENQGKVDEALDEFRKAGHLKGYKKLTIGKFFERQGRLEAGRLHRNLFTK